MACPCCRERINCGPLNPPRPIPSSVSVLINVGSVVSDTSGVVGCATWFPGAVNGTYVLPKIDTLTYGAIFGPLRLSFNLNAFPTYSLLTISFCQNSTPCISATSWNRTVPLPTLCDWPGDGGETVSNPTTPTNKIGIVRYTSCGGDYAGLIVTYDGQIDVALI